MGNASGHPRMGVKVSDKSTQPEDWVGKRERAPANGGDGLGYFHTVAGFDTWEW